MGRPKDRRERERERAHELLATSLKRHDCERALAALLCLAPEARAAHLPAVAPLLADAVQRAQASHDSGLLSRLAALARQEPRLLATLDGPALLEVRWALLWSAGQRSDFASAEEQLLALQPALESQAPALLSWLSAWVAGRGVIADAATLPPLPDDSEQLGYHRVARAPAPAPPQTAEQVEPAVIAAAATLRALDFRMLMLDWSRRLPTALARAVRIMAAKLAVREALLCAPERRHQAPLSLLAAMAPVPESEPDYSAELAQDVLLGLRIAVAYRSSELAAEEARVMSELLLLAARDPAQRRLVTAYAATLRFPAAAKTRTLELFAKLLQLEPDPGLLCAAIALWMHEEDQASPPPSFLSATLGQLLERPAPESSAWLRGLAPARQHTLLDFLREEAPPALGLRLADLAFAEADAPLRSALTELVVGLIEALPSVKQPSLSRIRTVSDCLKLIRRRDADFPVELDLMLDELPPQLPVPEWLRRQLLQTLRRDGRGALDAYDDQQRAEIQRFSGRMLGLGPCFAGLAIKAARSEAEALAIAHSASTECMPLDDTITLLRHANEANRAKVCAALIEQALRRFGNDPSALARAVIRLQQEDAPRPFVQPFARALLLVDSRFTGVRSAQILDALVIARRLVPARERRLLGLPTAAPKPRSAKKPKAGAKRPPPDLSEYF